MAGRLPRREELVRWALSALAFALVCALLTGLQLAFTPKGPAPWWSPLAWLRWFNGDRNTRFLALLTAGMTTVGLVVTVIGFALSVVMEERIKATVVEEAEAIREKSEEIKAEIIAEVRALRPQLSDPDMQALQVRIDQLEAEQTLSLLLIRRLVVQVVSTAAVPNIRLISDLNVQVNAIAPLVEEAGRPSNQQEISLVRAAVTTALSRGDLDTADQAYARGAESFAETRKMASLEEAEMYLGRARIALSRLDRLAAADHFHHAADLAEPFDAEITFFARQQEALSLFHHGLIFPGLDPLRRSAAVWRVLETSATAVERRASMQNELGNALYVLGDRAGGIESIDALKQAVATYRDALIVRSHAIMPTQWAGTQDNLGNVLQVLGARTGGAEGVDALNQAVAAHRAALSVRTQVDRPVDWATTQNNLGNTLRILGERFDNAEGVNALNQAVTAYQSALAVHTKDGMPIEWAMTQNNLGTALLALGQRAAHKDAFDTLNQAVAAYRAALTVYTTGEMPVDWAQTQSNLGYALQTLGQRTGGAGGIEVLNQAVTAQRAALTVHTKTAMPVNWAFTSENLALAYEALTNIDGDVVRLDHAIAVMNEVIPIFEATQASFNVEKAQRNRARMVAFHDRLKAAQWRPSWRWEDLPKGSA